MPRPRVETVAIPVVPRPTSSHTLYDVPSNLKGVFHFQMHNPGPWYHTKLRPGAIEFLQDLSEFFQLHIITFGVRLYAHIIARFLDPEDKFFHNRIMASLRH